MYNIENKYHYYYNKLNHNEQIVYHKVVKALINHQLKCKVSSLYNCNINHIMTAVKYENPYLCFVDFAKGVTYTNNEIFFNYLNYDLNKIDEILEPVFQNIRGKDQYTQVLYIHNSLCKRTFYDNNADNNINAFNMYGCIVEKCSVCDGISLAYSYILNKLNILNYVVIGYLDNIPHALNAVCINNVWCYIDVTNDLRRKDVKYTLNGRTIYPINYFYFGLTKSDLLNLNFTSKHLSHFESRIYNYMENSKLVFSSLKELEHLILTKSKSMNFIKFVYLGNESTNEVINFAFKALGRVGYFTANSTILSGKFYTIIFE